MSNPALDRRTLLAGAASALAAAPTLALAKGPEDAFADSPWRKLTAADWKKRLPPAAYNVLREADTEAPRSSPLNGEHRKGTFVCAGCALPLFKSDWKFESGTGWPSFHTAIRGNVATKRDLVLLIPRTEYHCARCLGHQGHIFNDGPPPTGKRWCNNGLALKFVPA